MPTEASAIAQRRLTKIHFDHQDMDYYLSWIMGRELYQGSRAAECLAVAAQIKEADAQSWQQGWLTLAQQVEAEAQSALQQGQTALARERFFCACTYYRAPLFLMSAQNAVFHPTVQKMQAAFRQAAALCQPPLERIAVTYQSQSLTGYLWPVDSSRQPRPTLIVIGGIETFAEDCYFMIGSSGAAQGYNVLTVDLPGQGLTPDQGLYFGARMEQPVSAVIDYALSRPEVDAQRLALFGFSWGGHIVFKGGQHDQRIKALIANPPMPNVFRSVLAQQKGHNRHDPLSRLAFDQIVWRMGLRISFNPRDIARRFAKAYDYFFYGKADLRQIVCPTLLLVGEGEAAVTLQIARECYDQLPNPQKKLVIFTKEDGGEAHCQVNNLALPNRVIFDWLAAILF
ncbi:MAG: alpha/beta fold hydrolase [Caldilinea sp. CFX5]|nr:alpha/beta fold hydrolase [Caldilinea sp. CFX5]